MVMRRTMTVILPMLIVADAAAQPAQCVADVATIGYTAPVPIVGIARDAVPLVDGATLAHEVMEVAPRGWMLAEPLTLTEAVRLTYPAGTPLRPEQRTGDVTTLCMPQIDASSASSDGAAARLWSSGFVQPCLVDGDGDGRAERVDIMVGNRALHVPTRELLQSLTLADPVALVAHPLGLPERRLYLHRRITLSANDGVMRLNISHAIQAQEPTPALGEFSTNTDGESVFRLIPSPPHPVMMTGNSYFSSAQEGRIALSLVDGMEGIVAGLPYRIARYPSGWRFEPMASRFAPWVHARCDGSGFSFGPRVALDSGGTGR